MTQLLPMKAWYSAEAGQIIELDDDVLGIVRQVRELYGDRIVVQLLEDSPEPYVFVEHCEDGTDRLIFTCNELDARALQRLQASDSHSRMYVDPYAQQEAEQDRLMEAKDAEKREVLAEVGEHIAHALKREGRADSLPLTVGLNHGRTQRAKR